ncbi:DNA topology modulation protein FlaR [Bacillus sp. BGMRC 2118]|nr:DNA topology modulation protein FlaR [Bacillus sp. BGMRC 2118]
MLVLVYKRIRVIGSVASGKTTLSKQLSTKLHIPYYELDNVVWKRTAYGDVRHTDEERDAMMQSITQSEQWIIEGVHSGEWVKCSFEKADVIILLNPHFFVRDGRIIKRFIRQMFGIEGSHYKPTIEMFFKMFKWNRQFEKEYEQLVEQLSQFDDKLVMISTKREVKNLLTQLN